MLRKRNWAKSTRRQLESCAEPRVAIAGWLGDSSHSKLFKGHSPSDHMSIVPPCFLGTNTHNICYRTRKGWRTQESAQNSLECPCRNTHRCAIVNTRPSRGAVRLVYILSWRGLLSLNHKFGQIATMWLTKMLWKYQQSIQQQWTNKHIKLGFKKK